ncbi:S41 family peptidase [Flavobacterium hydrophilum]|uniref:Peptidase S41 n=1 Tax=Flavobacterium hydrophilum TaxID=2211445 RepID=A0A2V4C027_9FLAO|nr:S41 family peptidase [Flavobacterium hydrophilum]PXY44232.1 peptidase S41 [Flavobacterium hydrophilum]
MKNILRSLFYFFLIAFSLQSCDDKDDVDKETYNAATALEIKDFIWRGLNEAYLWQADVPNLADNRFASQEDFNSFLKGYSEPEDLFEDLLNKPESKYPNDAIDRFSWIVEDYTVLEQELSGITKNSGIDFKLSYIGDGSDNLAGYVRYIIPNSDASKKDIKRGDLFTKVNGTQLTVSNYEKLLLKSNSYTLSLAVINNNTLVLTGKSVKLTKTTLEENPILINKIISSGSHKIGYLMYNGFYNEYDNALNQAFAELKSGGVTDLVLDLRYNGGGVVHSSTLLASMITGQFKGQVFSQRQYNPKQMALMDDEDLESLKERFTDKTNSGTALNSLNLNTVYIITTDNTASASELVINGLKPYVNVVQIGGTTVGKNVGSNTIYDSPSLLSKAQINPAHKYAMQPLTFKITNKDNFGDYTGGLAPTFALEEKVSTYGILGDPSEPLLNLAISKITGSTAKRIQADKGLNLPYFTDSKSMRRFGKEMYIENNTK